MHLLTFFLNSVKIPFPPFFSFFPRKEGSFANYAPKYEQWLYYLFIWFSGQHAIPLSQQLEYYKEYQSKLAKVAGSKQASSILSGALYLVSSGSSDFVQNYYINPYLNKFYSPDEFSSFLVSIFTNFIKAYITISTSHQFQLLTLFKPIYLNLSC